MPSQAKLSWASNNFLYCILCNLLKANKHKKITDKPTPHSEQNNKKDYSVRKNNEHGCLFSIYFSEFFLSRDPLEARHIWRWKRSQRKLWYGNLNCFIFQLMTLDVGKSRGSSFVFPASWNIFKYAWGFDDELAIVIDQTLQVLFKFQRKRFYILI